MVSKKVLLGLAILIEKSLEGMGVGEHISPVMLAEEHMSQGNTYHCDSAPIFSPETAHFAC